MAPLKLALLLIIIDVSWVAHAAKGTRAFITNVFLLMQAFKMIRQEKLSHACELLIMDWAMKFLPIGYRETQRDWFGKKGKPWHITVAINKADSEEIEVCLMLKQYLCHSFFQVSIQLFNKI